MFKPEPFVTRLAFAASDRPEAQEARNALVARYGEASDDDARSSSLWAATASC